EGIEKASNDFEAEVAATMAAALGKYFSSNTLMDLTNGRKKHSISRMLIPTQTTTLYDRSRLGF
ncbi:hypothetical protein HU145_05630, partial [Streptococcus suis]|uniref:hypothetical protein n=1 Tax=Streptococcus suis TaxID=1307 RepID=UPI001592BCC6